MGLGCDTATTITSRKAQTLVDGGYTFVCRYLGGSFKITSAEKKIILDAGLRIVSIWEYFTVDYDASYSDIRGGIKEYLQAVKAVFAENNYPYELGLYGSGDVLSYYKNTYTYTWLAAATDWSGSKDFTGWSLRQYDPNVTIGSGSGSIQIDRDESNGAAGGWK